MTDHKRSVINQRLVVGISGASGAIYGIRALQLLRAVPGVETHLIVTRAGRATIAAETAYTLSEVTSLADTAYSDRDLAAPPASGSFRAAGMLVAPCSIKTLSGIANCYDDTLLIRVADVTLKERRRLVLVVRETPLRAAHLRLMTEVTSDGAIVAPPVPAFYANPGTIDDLVDHTVGRALDLFGIDTGAVRRWTGLRAVRQDRGVPVRERSLPHLRTDTLADAGHQQLEEGFGRRHQRLARSPHHSQFPLSVRFGEREAGTFAAGRQPWQHGHPHPGLHHPPHDRKLTGFDRDPRREPGSRTHVHHQIAQTVPRLHRHKILAGQAGEADPGTARQPVTRRHQRRHRFPHKGLSAQVRARTGHPDDRQIELTGVHHPFELLRDVVLDQSDLHPRVAPPALGKNARQQMRAYARQHSQSHPSPAQSHHLAHPLLRLLDLGQRPLRVRQERFPRNRQRHSPPQPVEQPRPHLLLELAHLGGQRRLRQEQPLGRTGETALLRHRHHVPKLMEFHACHGATPRH